MANRLRTAITVSTVALGAFILSLLVSLANGALATILTGVEAVGGRELLFLEPNSQAAIGGKPGLPISFEDRDALVGRLPHARDIDYLMSIRDQAVGFAGHDAQVDVAIGGGYHRLLSQSLIAGRWIDDTENARVIVLSSPVAAALFGTASQALGKDVVLWQARYTVVGVSGNLDTYGFNMGSVSRDRAVFLSTATASRAEGIEPHGIIVVRDDGSGDHRQMAAMAMSILSFRHGERDDIESFDMAALIHTFDVAFLGIKAMIAIVAAVSLVVAGAGVMNVMLATVRQRLTEIGIRRALGASGAEIERQFMIEAAVLSTTGGILGSGGGAAVAVLLGLLVRRAIPSWQAAPSTGAAVAAVVVAGGVGLAFGAVPARRARGLSVVTCLRGGSD